jgi:sigma-E factor negative regulatory protein RseC
MLEETALVVEVDGSGVWVETRRQSTCGTCSAQKGCGTAALAKVMGQRRNRVRVLSELPLRRGDRVVIGIRENALVRGSLAVYAVPLVLLLGGAVSGTVLAQSLRLENADLASVLLGMGGLAAGLWWLKRFTRRIRDDRDFQPVVLRKLAPAGLEDGVLVK